jgi:hypothetical protein
MIEPGGSSRSFVAGSKVKTGLFAAAEPSDAHMNDECDSGVSHTSSTLHPEPVLRAGAF